MMDSSSLKVEIRVEFGEFSVLTENDDRDPGYKICLIGIAPSNFKYHRFRFPELTGPDQRLYNSDLNKKCHKMTTLLDSLKRESGGEEDGILQLLGDDQHHQHEDVESKKERNLSLIFDKQVEFQGFLSLLFQHNSSWINKSHFKWFIRQEEIKIDHFKPMLNLENINDINHIFVFVEAQIIRIGSYQQFTKIGAYSSIDLDDKEDNKEFVFWESILPKKIRLNKDSADDVKIVDETVDRLRTILGIRPRYSDGKMVSIGQAKKLCILEKRAIQKLVSYFETVKNSNISKMGPAGDDKISKLIIVVHSYQTIFPLLLSRIHFYKLEKRFYDAVNGYVEILKMQQHPKLIGPTSEKFDNFDDIYTNKHGKEWPILNGDGLDKVARLMCETVTPCMDNIYDYGIISASKLKLDPITLRELNGTNNISTEKIEIIQGYCPNFVEDITFDHQLSLNLLDSILHKESSSTGMVNYCSFCSDPATAIEECKKCPKFAIKLYSLISENEINDPSSRTDCLWMGEIVIPDYHTHLQFDRIKYRILLESSKGKNHLPSVLTVYFGKYVHIPFYHGQKMKKEVIATCQRIQSVEGWSKDSSDYCNSSLIYIPRHSVTIPPFQSLEVPLIVKEHQRSPNCTGHNYKIRKPLYIHGLEIYQNFITKLKNIQLSLFNRTNKHIRIFQHEDLLKARCCFNHEYICDIFKPCNELLNDENQDENESEVDVALVDEKVYRSNFKYQIAVWDPDLICGEKSFLFGTDHDYYIKPKKMRKINVFLTKINGKENVQILCDEHSHFKLISCYQDSLIIVPSENSDLSSSNSVEASIFEMRNNFTIFVQNISNQYLKVNKNDVSFKALCCDQDGKIINSDLCRFCRNKTRIRQLCVNCPSFKINLTGKTDGSGLWLAIADINDDKIDEASSNGIKLIYDHPDIVGSNVTSLVQGKYLVLKFNKMNQKCRRGMFIGKCQILPRNLRNEVIPCERTKPFFAASDLKLQPGMSAALDLTWNDTDSDCSLKGHFLKIVYFSISDIQSSKEFFPISKTLYNKIRLNIENTGNYPVNIKRGNQVLIAKCIKDMTSIVESFLEGRIVDESFKGFVEEINEGELRPPGEEPELIIINESNSEENINKVHLLEEVEKDDETSQMSCDEIVLVDEEGKIMDDDVIIIPEVNRDENLYEDIEEEDRSLSSMSHKTDEDNFKIKLSAIRKSSTPPPENPPKKIRKYSEHYLMYPTSPIINGPEEIDHYSDHDSLSNSEPEHLSMCDPNNCSFNDDEQLICPVCPVFPLVSCTESSISPGEDQSIFCRVVGLNKGTNKNDKIKSLRVLPLSRSMNILTPLNKVSYVMSGDSAFIFPVIKNNTNSSITIEEGEFVALTQYHKINYTETPKGGDKTFHIQFGKIKVPKLFTQDLSFLINGILYKGDENLKNNFLDSIDPPETQMEKFLTIISSEGKKSKTYADFVYESVLSLEASRNVSALGGKSISVDTTLKGNIDNLEIERKVKIIPNKDLAHEWKISDSENIMKSIKSDKSVVLSLINQNKGPQHILKGDLICEIKLYRHITTTSYHPKLRLIVAQLEIKLKPGHFASLECYLHLENRIESRKFELITLATRKLEIVTDSHFLETNNGKIYFIIRNHSLTNTINPGKHVVGMAKIIY